MEANGRKDDWTARSASHMEDLISEPQEIQRERRDGSELSHRWVAVVYLNFGVRVMEPGSGVRVFSSHQEPFWPSAYPCLPLAQASMF